MYVLTYFTTPGSILEPYAPVCVLFPACVYKQVHLFDVHKYEAYILYLSVFLSLSSSIFFFLSWVANTQLNHWTKRVVST